MAHIAQRVMLGLVIAAQAAFGALPASAQLFAPPQRKLLSFLMAAPYWPEQP